MDGGSADPSRRLDQDGRARAPAGRVMLVTGHRAIRDALRHALDGLGLDVTTDAPPGREAVLAALTAHPHVALVDVASDPAVGLATCRLLRKEARQVEPVALATHDAATRQALRDAGVARVVSAEASMVEVAGVLASVAAIATRRSRSGPAGPGTVERPPLSDREHEVIVLAATGMTDGQISRTLAISPKTVKNHLHHVYVKLGVRGRTDAVMLCVRRGLISP